MGLDKRRVSALSSKQEGQVAFIVDCVRLAYLRNEKQARTVALKKSDLYSSLWAACDDLRGPMDPSHGKTFIDLLDRNLPSWRGTRDRLNQAPLSHTAWSAAEGS
jgi:hypothetical protein